MTSVIVPYPSSAPSNLEVGTCSNMVLPAGNTASRCASGSTLKGGSLRYNNETYAVEYFDSDPSSCTWKSVAHTTGLALNCLTDVVTATASAGNVLVGQGSCYTAKAVSGDITLASSGCMTVSTGVICDQMYNPIDSNTDYLVVVDATDNAFKKVLACDFSVLCATTAGSTGGSSGTADKLTTARTIGMTGDVVWTSSGFDGSGNVTGTATIQANSVTLGTDTSGNYVGTLTAGTGLTSSGATSGENVAHSLSVDAAQAGITSVGTLTSLTMGGTIKLHGATSDPAGTEGMMYYKTDTCKFRGYANGAWTDLH